MLWGKSSQGLGPGEVLNEVGEGTETWVTDTETRKEGGALLFRSRGTAVHNNLPRFTKMRGRGARRLQHAGVTGEGLGCGR